ncbi:hypothetical protein AQUCO_05700077v1 [Aquilegia coerulea]|uniref:RWP-RK domain-containing protein n=1 Tax=Aquilegia coerulea TaxID=218851 RepID=A0A2G5CH05_AQUCA|nr:hypothetical protein AQUCO_05700077v1 [Aquilegia coerulea]
MTTMSFSSTTTTQTTVTTTTIESLTFDGISKFFNMPIADAATNLGVCSSVLKKICRDNGLVRWPYRKFLAGKSVEEIQKDAARERRREMIELARAARQKDAATTSLYATTTILGQQGNNLSQDGWQQGNNPSRDGGKQGSNPSQEGLSNDMLYSGSARNLLAHLDEFKEGFPSNGLSTVTMRWWGDHTSDANDDEMLGEESAIDGTNKQQSHNAANKCMEGKSDTTSEKSNIVPQGTALLLSVRESAAAEGREALKLGVHGGYRSFKLNRREKMLLHKVFDSSLPSQWKINSS